MLPGGLLTTGLLSGGLALGPCGEGLFGGLLLFDSLGQVCGPDVLGGLGHAGLLVGGNRLGAGLFGELSLFGGEVFEGLVDLADVGELAGFLGHRQLLFLERSSVCGEVLGGLLVAGQLGLLGGGGVGDEFAHVAGEGLLGLLPLAGDLVLSGLGGESSLLGGHVGQGLSQLEGLGHLIHLSEQFFGQLDGVVDVLIGLGGGLAAVGRRVGEFNLSGLVFGPRDLGAHFIEFRFEAGEGALGGLGGDVGGRGLGLGQVLAHAVHAFGQRLAELLGLGDLFLDRDGVFLGFLEFVEDSFEGPADGLLLGLERLHGVGLGREVEFDGDDSGGGLSGPFELGGSVVGGTEAEGELLGAPEGQFRQQQRHLAGRRSVGGILPLMQGNGDLGALAGVGCHDELGLREAEVIGHGELDGQLVGRLEAEPLDLGGQNLHRGRLVGQGDERPVGRGVAETVLVGHRQGPPSPHAGFQFNLELADACPVRAGQDLCGHALGGTAVQPHLGRLDRLVCRGRDRDLGARDGADVAGNVVLGLGLAQRVGRIHVVSVEAFDDGRRHDLDVVELAERIAGVNAVPEVLGGRRAGDRETRIALFRWRQERHVGRPFSGVGQCLAQRAPLDGGVSDLDLDLQTLPLGQDGVAGGYHKHVGRDVGQIHERRHRTLQQPRRDTRVQRPQRSEHDEEADGRHEVRPGGLERHFRAWPDATGVLGGLGHQGGNEGLGTANLGDVAAGEQFDGRTETFLEFGVAGLDGPGDARQGDGLGDRQDEQPHGHRRRRAQGREGQHPPEGLREQCESGVDGHDEQQRADARSHDGGHAAQQNNAANAVNQPTQRLGNRLRDGTSRQR